MGGISTKEFADLIEETPPPTPDNKRVLEFDPRSPTDGITRTPIQIEKTPDSVIDPRSPTVGISRTPIYEKTNSKTESDVEALVRPPFVLDDIDDTNEEKGSEEAINILQDSMESKGVENSPLTTKHQNTTDDSMEICLLPARVQANKKKQMRVKTVFNENSSQQIKTRKSGTRSPLTPVRVDSNSPRIIVQRKQVAKLGLLQRQGSGAAAPVKYERIHDKENVQLQY